MQKLLIITQNFYPVIGSAGNRMKNIFELLSEKNIDTHVLTTEPAYPNKNLYKQRIFWDEENLNNNEKIMRLPIKTKKYENSMLGRLKFYGEIALSFTKKIFKLKKEKYDYILVSSPPIFIVLSAFIAKKLYKTKLILEVRDLWPDSLTGVRKFNNKFVLKIFKFLEKKMYNNADAIIINSLGFKAHILSKLKDKEKTILFLPNGARAKEIDNIIKKEDDHFQVVYAGNLGLAQDTEKLQELAKKLNNHDIHFEIIGYGARATEFKEFIEKNNLKYVKLNNPMTRKETLKVISQSNCAVALLNDEEVFSTVLPGKVIDYITCKTPVIAAVKGQAANLITQNKVGYVFENEEIGRIVDKIIYLKENIEIRKQLEENCGELINAHFLWEKNIEKIMPLLNE
ncbi:glycosyltransferase family 4 protein [Salirhabdus sp. Marseille-P4669]|uniref:glycosyltransferase family 4 protein n=1 Tax=Salirhabdus sp. Marseille-P4669 TaxID=2042310 RepID=UPI001358A65A|nr:glycosyltransferase family 4 protein [Salirhabdus sp. Marseille-P4669]